MKKRRSTRSASRLVDVILGIVCISGMAFFLTLFVRDWNKSANREDEEPIATVVHKKNTTQRRFSDEDVWQKVKISDLVYDGDRIRTDTESEATIIYTDGTSIDLYENTMVTIRSFSEGTGIDFSKGSVNVVASTASQTKPVVVTNGNKMLNLKENSSVVLESSRKGEASVAVTSGSVEVRQKTAAEKKPAPRKVTEIRTPSEPEKEGPVKGDAVTLKAGDIAVIEDVKPVEEIAAIPIEKAVKQEKTEKVVTKIRTASVKSEKNQEQIKKALSDAYGKEKAEEISNNILKTSQNVQEKQPETVKSVAKRNDRIVEEQTRKVEIATEAEARKAEKARVARELAEKKAAEEKKARELAAKKAAEEKRKAREEQLARERAEKAERERIAREEARRAEEARKAEEARRAEEARIAEEKRRAEEARIAEEKRRAEEARLEAERKAREEQLARKRAEKAERQRIAREEARRAEKARKAEEARRAEEARIAEEKRRAEKTLTAPAASASVSRKTDGAAGKTAKTAESGAVSEKKAESLKEEKKPVQSKIVNKRPVLKAPSDGLSVTEEFFSDGVSSLKFSWGKMSDAKKYKFVLHKEGLMDKKIVEKTLKGNAYTLKASELEKLDNGRYVWSVQGVEVLEGKTFESKLAESGFSVNLEDTGLAELDLSDLLH